jgi:hypothetical protein
MKAHEEKFILKVSAGLPQSETDKKILSFHWELRPEFKRSKGKVLYYGDLYTSHRFYNFTWNALRHFYLLRCINLEVVKYRQLTRFGVHCATAAALPHITESTGVIRPDFPR